PENGLRLRGWCCCVIFNGLFYILVVTDSERGYGATVHAERPTFQSKEKRDVDATIFVFNLFYFWHVTVVLLYVEMAPLGRNQEFGLHKESGPKAHVHPTRPTGLTIKALLQVISNFLTVIVQIGVSICIVSRR